MMHIVLVGTRAQLVKMAPVIREMKRQGLAHLFVLTGQHTESMDDLIRAFQLGEPDDVWVRQGEAATRAKVFKWLRSAWKAAKKRTYLSGASSMVVHGDTMSTLLGAVVGRRFGIPVAHVEAGLRSFNYFHPFPEELTRVLVSRRSTLHFCPGEWAVGNLRRCRARGDRIVDTGLNTIIDSLRYALSVPAKPGSDELYAVVSIHRYENLAKRRRFDELMGHVETAATRLPVKFVLHPVTRNRLKETGWTNHFVGNPRITLMERMDYVSFVQLLAGSQFLITDGGSNQEEAAYMGLPCLLMRKASERREGLGGNAVLADYDETIIGDFIEEHRSKTWSLKPLPDVYPSRTIVGALAAAAR